MNNSIIFIVLIFAFLGSCKKKCCHNNNTTKNFIFNTNSNCTDTEVSTLSEPSLGFIFTFNNKYSTMPYFNPNNPNEFIYYNQYSTNNLYIFNRTTNTKSLVINAVLIFPPKWGKNNWILLNTHSKDVYKIKTNGDSLLKIISSECYNPEWNKDATQIAFHTTNWNTSKSIGVIYNTQSNIKDTLPFMLTAGKCWQNSTNKIIFYSTEQNMKGFVSADINNRTRTLLTDIESPTPPCWINDSEFVYSFNSKIFIFNILTGNNNIIAELCSNEHIGYISYSPISKELITSIDHWKALDKENILISSKIMILNFNDNSVSYITP